MSVWGLVSVGGLKGGVGRFRLDTFKIDLILAGYCRFFLIVLWSPDNGWLGLGSGPHSLLNVLLIF